VFLPFDPMAHSIPFLPVPSPYQSLVVTLEDSTSLVQLLVSLHTVAVAVAAGVVAVGVGVAVAVYFHPSLSIVNLLENLFVDHCHLQESAAEVSLSASWSQLHKESVY
jgi:hypothetical protein